MASVQPPSVFKGIVKKYVRGKNICRVTFTLPKEAALNARSVHIVGDFNNWDIYSTEMKKSSDGSFSVTLDLEPGREYQFRYLINEIIWENDWKADRYVPSPFGNVENSVVSV